MLISFSGPQSSGKSTLLNLMQELSPAWSFIPEITRLVKREYNLPINELGGDITQTMIMCEHLRNAYIKRDNITVLDRCSLDGIVYTHWLCDKRKVTMGIYSHAKYVFDSTIDRYDTIFYTSPHDVPIVDDGERSTNIEFREEITDLFERYMANIPTDKIFRVTGSIKERLCQITLKLDSMGLTYRRR